MRFRHIPPCLAGIVLAGTALGQGTLADYQRAQGIQESARRLVTGAPGPAKWIGDSQHFWYWKSVKGGTEFVVVDASAAARRPAFDHDKLAMAINAVSGGKYTGLTLPFGPVVGSVIAPARLASSELVFLDGEKALQFGHEGFLWKCNLADYTCAKGAAIIAGGGRGGAAPDAPLEIGGDPVDGIEFPQAGVVGGGGRGQMRRGCAPNSGPAACLSFDSKWEALIQNFNVFIKPADGKGAAWPLSLGGSEGNAYTLRSVAWSPDSQKLVAYHVRPGYDRQVHYIESSPTDQLQPKHSSIQYRKPGDALDIAYPALFDIATKHEIELDLELFPNPYAITPAVWWKDGRGYTFEYNQRGHQMYRVVEVDAATGKARALIDEQTKTFFYYNLLDTGLSGGRRFRFDVNDGREIVWASERDGWEHLYLYDGVTGKLKNQITHGNWIVRNVLKVDEAARQIWFEAGGMVAGQDPYFPQYYRINFDGSGLMALTEADGYHTAVFSTGWKYFVDTWSRVDLAPVSQLRRTADKSVVMELEKGDASAGLRAPEVFVAKGRDGKTDIWGMIVRPTNFDISKKYPVIEQIYAGPQGSFVPKTFSAAQGTQALAELGFIVVQIDGMGTSNRSKAFHDVAWHDLGDAGFPDRILWHQAVAAKYPQYDLSRVGIYGTSAGGQNALGGVLFHPDFYKVVVTNSGCHDNRMDKIWWNEQWMGWPLGPQYAAASNVDNAYRLQGKALIIIPEMDSNVDPASSLQVVNALVKAKKHFDMMFIPGQNHGTGVLADQHYLQDYFVHHLLGVEPPDWNRVSLVRSD